MTLQMALGVDIAVLLVCALSLVLTGRASHTHPGVIYLVFHVLVFTFRGWSILQGAPTFLWLSVSEAVHALAIADLFLVSCTMAWVMSPRPKWLERPAVVHEFDPKVMYWVTVVCMPVGLYFLATQTYTSGSIGNDIQLTSSYQVLAVTWPGLLLLGLIYVRGFRWYLLLPLASYLMFMMVQGQGRFRVVLPAILLAQMWLDRRGMKWPSPRVLVGLTLLVPLFLGMDSIGASYRAGTLSFSTAQTAISDAFQKGRSGEASDQAGLDSLGIAVSQSDRLGEPLYGEAYTALAFLPVPRPWWPDKPPLNGQIIALSTADRPLDTVGAVMTMPGALYVDFRWVGIVFGGFIIGRVGLWAYMRAYAHGRGTAAHFLYLLIAASLIQVYRDSPASLITFLLVTNAPLVAIVALHRIFGFGKTSVPLDSQTCIRQGRGDKR